MTEQLPPNPLLQRLGYDTDARIVIFHADDVGMCHGSNRAFVELAQFGIIKSGSIMMPCPWAPEILHICQADANLDVGVHLTLTSEWDNYRWGPLSTRDVSSGLLDSEGYFWHTTQQVEDHVDVPAAAGEMRAQIEQMRQMGIDFTHIDTHMGASVIPKLLEAYAQIGLDYQTPILLSRYLDDYVSSLETVSPEAMRWSKFIASLEAQGMLLPDRFRITPLYSTDLAQPNRPEVYEEMLRSLPPGVTYFSLHPNQAADMDMIAPQHTEARAFEYQYFQSARLQEFLDAEGIIPIGYRHIRDLMRASI